VPTLEKAVAQSLVSSVVPLAESHTLQSAVWVLWEQSTVTMGVPRVPHLLLHMTCTHSLHTGVRQRCACVFLALNTSFHSASGDIYSELVRMIKMCLMKYALQLATAMDN